jgi:hypothetical protein
MATKKDIIYLNKDFNQFRDNLINFAKTYYKKTFNNIDEGNPDMMYVEMASYVGDVLSYYSDYNLHESLINNTFERANIINIAQSYGYKPRPTFPARTTLDVYQLLPSIVGGGQALPDWSYALSIKPNMQISSNDNSQIMFRTLDSINFAVSSSTDTTDVTIYQTDPNTGIINYYLIKKNVQVEAGQQKSYTFQVTDPQEYLTITLPDNNVISIDEVLDSDGNQWYEVPFLAQDTTFIETVNTETNNPDLAQFKAQTPYLLKLKKTSKRFITRYTSNNQIELRFGSGYNVQPDEILTPNPDNVGQPFSVGISRINTTWDPANFIYTKAYGQTPANTTLTIKYSVGGGILSNVGINTLTTINQVEFYNQPTTINPNILSNIKQSLAVNNQESATGGRGEETTDEIRNNALAFFAAQDRMVNLEDFIVRAYSMPAKYGSISKAYIVQDEQLNFFDYSQRIINPFGLNLYILSSNSQNQLVQTNNAIKTNFKTYLSKFKMLTDSINIKDAFVINIAVSFKVTVLPDFIANEVLLRAIDSIKQFFNISNWQINQPIVIDDIIQTLANTKGVQSVIGIKVYNQFDSTKGYIPNIYDIQTATRNGIIYPSLDPSIFEVRFPDQDIYGKVISY